MNPPKHKKNSSLARRGRLLPTMALILLAGPSSGSERIAGRAVIEPVPVCSSPDVSPLNAPWQLGDFLVSTWWNYDGTSGAPSGIAVYDQNLVFKTWVDPSLWSSASPQLTSAGNVVFHCDIGGYPSWRVYEYAPSGVRVRSLSTGEYIADAISDGLDQVTYTSHHDDAIGVTQWDGSGNRVRTFGTSHYGGLCVLPGGVLWAAVSYGESPKIHVFDLATGMQTGTIIYDNGQTSGWGHYSPSTNTVLVSSPNHALFERTTTGSFVRKFVYPYSNNWYVAVYAATRGPGGDVYAIVEVGTSTYWIGHWKADGTWVGQTSPNLNVDGVMGILWTGPAATHSAPTILAPDQVACVLPGTPISFSVTATDPEGTLTTLSATGLPSSASFPTVSAIGSVAGTFTWTPLGTDIGTWTINFNAVDSGSPPLTSTRKTVITVVSASPITSHPQPQSICAGQTATFSTSATATAYQWQFSDDGVNWANIGGATSSSWTTPPFYIDGYVRCLVTTSCGVIATNAARLTITPPPGSPGNSLRLARTTPSSVHLQWGICSAASTYRILRCNASNGACFPSLLATASSTSADDTSASAASLWYGVEAANACGITP